MSFDHEEYLKGFYQALSDRPLEPEDPSYVHLYEDRELAAADPIAALATTIEWNPLESKQLFSGFRGTGKSTELRRLRRKLMSRGNAVVALCDMEDYLDLHTPVDISDFLISVAGAFSDALEDEALLGKDMLHESYWTRFRSFVSETQVEIPELSASTKVGGVRVGLKANLKNDPSFRRQVQQRMKGHLAALSSDVNAFMEACVKALKQRHGDDVQVVILLDSVERIRGTSINADDVAASVEMLFEGHADKLGFPYMHVVYTVPPWLKIKAPGVAGLYDNGQQIPCVKVHEREDGKPCQAGLDTLARLISKRGDWSLLLRDRAALDDLCLASGGYLRDLFRLLQALLRHARGRSLPVDAHTLDLVKHEIRNSYLPISNQDAAWLDHIRRSRSTQLEDGKRLHELARFFDNHLVLTYRNGQEWWSVHPLLADHIERQVAEQQRAGDAPVS